MAQLVMTSIWVVLVSLLVHFQPSDGCLCHVIPNFACPPPPNCCESGTYTYDECGCCLTCAKDELQPCGGPSGSHGKCAQGLACLKTCTACRTLGTNPEPCVFPFVYDGNDYDSCTSVDAAEGAVWCATQVDSNGTVLDGRWGDCSVGCPGARRECNEKRFSIIVGKCINPAVPGAIPNWFGAPPYRLLEPTNQLFEAPVCDSSIEGINRRHYDNTCRCAEGEDTVELALDGTVRGNCTGVDTNDRDSLNPVFCFLENVRDPTEPKSGCYDDTTWSAKDGRFWSSDACNGLPPVASIKGQGLQEAPRSLLGRNHPFVRAAQQVPFRRPTEKELVSKEDEEPVTEVIDEDRQGQAVAFFHDGEEEYYHYSLDDYPDLYDFDDQDDDATLMMNLPIVNQRENGIEFLPTPLPVILKDHSRHVLPIRVNGIEEIVDDPVPLTTQKSVTSTTTTTTTTTTLTTTTTSTEEIVEDTTLLDDVLTTTIAETIEPLVATETTVVPPTTILPSSSSKWQDTTEVVVENLTDMPEEEVEENVVKDGSKIVQALQRAAKKRHFESEAVVEELEEEDRPTQPLVDLGIFGSFWLQKARDIDQDGTTSKPNPVFRPEDYTDKYPELRL